MTFPVIKYTLFKTEFNLQESLLFYCLKLKSILLPWRSTKLTVFQNLSRKLVANRYSRLSAVRLFGKLISLGWNFTTKMTKFPEQTWLFSR